MMERNIVIARPVKKNSALWVYEVLMVSRGSSYQPGTSIMARPAPDSGPRLLGSLDGEGAVVLNESEILMDYCPVAQEVL